MFIRVHPWLKFKRPLPNPPSQNDLLNRHALFRAIFEKMLAQLRAGDLSIPVDAEGVHKPPLARHLPARKFLEQKLFQLVLGAAPVGRDTRHNEVNAVRVPARHAEDQALGNGFVLPQRLFDGCRRHFPAGHIDVVAGATAQINRSVLELGEITSLKDTSSQSILRLRPLGFAYRPALYQEDTVRVE